MAARAKSLPVRDGASAAPSEEATAQCSSVVTRCLKPMMTRWDGEPEHPGDEAGELQPSDARDRAEPGDRRHRALVPVVNGPSAGRPSSRLAIWRAAYRPPWIAT